MEQQQQFGRTLFDFLSSLKQVHKIIPRIVFFIILLVALLFACCLVFGYDLKVSLKEGNFSITKNTHNGAEVNESVIRIDSLVERKYIPLINSIYREVSGKSEVENQAIRNRFVIESGKLFKLLNLKLEIVKNNMPTDSINKKINQIEQD